MKRLLAVGLLLMAALPARAADWQVEPEQSRLAFSGTQQDGRFEGRFQKWKAQIRFDPQHLEKSLFDVTVDVASVDTGSRERDQYLPDKEWFAAKQFPSASFRATEFSARGGNEYLAKGQLTLRGITRPVTLSFKWNDQGERAELHAQTTLDRTAFGIGQGDFSDSDVVGHEVRVTADLNLRR